MDQIGSDMLVDSEYEEKQDVAIISPDDPMEDEPEPELRADDFEAMQQRHFPENPDFETEDYAVSTWEITDWRTLGKKERGPVFHCGGHPWRILFFPFGNNVDFASFYLEQGFEDSKPPEDWYACAQFMLVLWNPRDPRVHVVHHAHHRFTAEEGDWGFTRFSELRRLFSSSFDDRGVPLVEDDSAKVTAYVRVLKDPTGVLWHNLINYDSKKQTGMVGLKNQGATCYLNSLLQSLYFTDAFRKAVYQIPTENETDKTNSAFALQRLFYSLQVNKNAVATNELTTAFGWDSKQIFEQQDVQELTRILMERLEEKMKGTEAENALAKMFVGKMKTYISCINVNYESSRIEDFWDLQLNVRGNKNLDESFKDYIQVETMDGENKYFAEGHGLQDAKKGVIFESFPEVLHLQLKRFEYDLETFVMTKVNDRYEFPEAFDAAPYLSENADKSEPYIYHLHGVLVHSGDLNAGHYYAFLKPEKNGDFYKFDDDRVTKCLKKEALEENFGGDYGSLANGAQRNPYTRTWSTKRSMNAYMLVYIRASRLDRILDDEEIAPPPHLAARFAEERALMEKRRKEREEAHLYQDISVASLDEFRAHEGFDIVNWRADTMAPAAPKQYRVLKTKTIDEVKQTVGQDYGIEPAMIRFWSMVNRQNQTCRPDQPITPNDMTIEDAFSKYGNNKNANFKLWLEAATEKDGEGSPLFGDSLIDVSNGAPNNKPILLFIKHFDPLQQTLLGAGHIYAAWQDKVSDLSPQILKLMGWEAGTGFRLYEEIKQHMIEAMKPKSTLVTSEIQDGDIITVQQTLSEKEQSALAADGKPTEVKEFYDYLLNRISVSFYARGSDAVDPFTLVLSKRMTYDQLATKVGEHLSVEPTHLRFSTINASTGRPKATIKRNQVQSLGAILITPQYSYYGATGNQRSDAMYYEVLDMSLSDLEQRKNIKISWLPNGITKEEAQEVLVPKTGNISDVISQLQKKANIPDEVAADIRVYSAHTGKVHQQLGATYPISNLNEFFNLYAEKIPEEEKDADENDRIICCFHFEKEPNKHHHIPFPFLMKEGEVFKDTKERLSKRTGIVGKPFEKIKFAVISRMQLSKPEYLSDDDILSEKLVKDGDHLGLDHINKTRTAWNRTDSIFIR